MTAVIFVGPSVPVAEARALLPEAVFLPPVAQGDVIRVARRRPKVIGIVDGYFERVPAVWHKEILWAMSRGIHVLGSASMGALRAAELAPFGMVGVGWIFEAYRDGTLEDDDEVAVAHATAEAAFKPLSEAMVNIRRTLARAVEDSVVGRATAESLIAAAKAMFYADRAYPRILQAGAELGLAAEELARLRGWLPGHAVAQKRDDALALVAAVRELVRADPPALQVRYSFQHTEWWDYALRGAGVAELGGTTEIDHEALVDELRLQPRAFADAFDGALVRALAADEAERRGHRVDEAGLNAALDDLVRAHGLADDAALARWCAAQRLGSEDLLAFLRDQAAVDWARAQHGRAATERLADELRASGRYARLHERALHKQQQLAVHGLELPGEADLGMDQARLVAWYFAAIEMAVPEDLGHYAAALGFADVDALVRAIARERAYRVIEFEGRR